MKKRILMLGALLCSLMGTSVYAEADDTIQNKVFAGYQAWFNTEGDGSPKNSWIHWGTPEPGKLTFETYPDVRDYSDEALKETKLAELGNGAPSKLFSSFSDDVMDKHFSMMKEYGIDGVAVQKFGSNTIIGKEINQQNFNAIMEKVRAAAEKHDRLFYLMYDISGLSEENLVQALTEDWEKVMVEKLDITSSPSYAREGEKPIVCLWGLGIRSGTPEQYCEIIDWFHEHGCYVIGGVPNGWRSKMEQTEGLEEAFCKLDMISPWAVGSMTTDEDVDSHAKVNLSEDKKYLDEKGIAYQPVMYPGFAWSNWKSDAVRNQIPRRAGDFMWRQAYNIANLGITCGYVAMFDEYDESTAILKLAEDSSMIPKDQYFLTASADGVYTSSDLYLRLTGYISKALRGEAEVTEEMPIPLSIGPVYFRTSFEKGLDAQPTAGSAEVVKDEISRSGRYSLELNSKTKESKLTELELNDKTSLTTGINVYLASGSPSVKLGLRTDSEEIIYTDIETKENEWVLNEITNDISGKTITGLIVVTEGDGEYKLYIDDVTAAENESYIDKKNPGTKYNLYARNMYNLGLLEGEGDGEFIMNLEKKATREQAVKAILGVLGEKAAEGTDVPFKDLSDWSVPYVARAYEKGIVEGVTEEFFNASAAITKREATAILLRALGYEGDPYKDCASMAVSAGLYKDESMTAELDKPLTYDDLVFLTYRSLFTHRSGSDDLLLGELLKKGVFTNVMLEKNLDVAEEYNSSLKPPARAVFDTEYFYNLMSIVINNEPTKGDSYTRAEVKNGVPCVLIPERQYMYCQVSDAYVSPEDSRIQVTITYLDEGTGELGFHYNSKDEALVGNARSYKAYNFEPRTDSGEWKTQTAIIEDAAFSNKQNGGADMRVFGKDLCIKEIQVEKLD